MATMWRKAMLYLGLGPDEEYDDYNQGYDDPAPVAAPLPGPAPGPEPEQATAIGAVRPMHPRAENGSGSGHDFATQVGESGSGGSAASPLGGARPRPRVVRPMPVASTARPRLVVAGSFNQAQAVADTFKGGQPVVMNLRSTDREVSRRLIDFSSGLCYGLGGRMEKLDSQVYLLSPTNVDVSSDEKERLAQRDYED